VGEAQQTAKVYKIGVLRLGQGALAARHASTAIPIVVVNHPDLVGSGLVASFARPGGNVTGLSTVGPDLVGKQVQLLKEAEAQLSELREAEIVVRPLGMRLRATRS
jgi:ABC-type uncharacterized transport system substrate-binding protein